MRTRTLLSITLLGLLLWASCIQADDTDAETEETETPEEDVSVKTGAEEAEEEEEEEEADANEDKDEDEDEDEDEEAEDEEEDAPRKEKTTEIKEEKDVMVLHINNFDRALRENQFLMVEFYAPWCGHCKQLEPIYAKAAGKLKSEKSAMRLAKVNAIEEKELADEFKIEGFPTLKLFMNGDRKQPVEFTGETTVKGIIGWMKRRTRAQKVRA